MVALSSLLVGSGSGVVLFTTAVLVMLCAVMVTLVGIIKVT